MHTYYFCLYLLNIDLCWYFSDSLSLSLSLSVSCSMVPKYKSTPSWNPFRSKASTSDSTFLTFGFVIRRPVQTSQRTFLDKAFIRNAKSSYWIFPILTFPLSSTVGVGSHFMASWSLVPPWSYRSFTPTCTNLIILYLISSLVFGVRTL